MAQVQKKKKSEGGEKIKLDLIQFDWRGDVRLPKKSDRLSYTKRWAPRYFPIKNETIS